MDGLSGLQDSIKPIAYTKCVVCIVTLAHAAIFQSQHNMSVKHAYDTHQKVTRIKIGTTWKLCWKLSKLFAQNNSNQGYMYNQCYTRQSRVDTNIKWILHNMVGLSPSSTQTVVERSTSAIDPDVKPYVGSETFLPSWSLRIWQLKMHNYTFIAEMT